MAKKDLPPIIIKKKKRASHDAHSSAWKIALADFMTALMCFFLVMWLTSILNTDVNKETSKFFTAAGVDASEVGIGGILGGQTITVDGPAAEMSAEFTSIPPLGAREESDAQSLGPFPEPSEQELSAMEALRIDDMLRQQEASAVRPVQLIETLQKIKGSLGKLEQESRGAKKRLHIVAKPHVIRIDLLDSHHAPLFKVGSHKLSPVAEKMLKTVIKTIAPLKRPVSIIGHTDSLRYDTKNYTNWDLSSDRAQETRRFITKIAPGMPIASVVGKGSTQPAAKNPADPQNRRISLEIFLKDPAKEPSAQKSTGPTLESYLSQSSQNKPNASHQKTTRRALLPSYFV